jgi:hexosaminidase
VRITDRPRYEHRGVMLDIARHFQTPAAVKRLIDSAVAYKINVLHLHVSDDQGFRIATNGRPELTQIGGQFSINNDPGGY